MSLDLPTLFASGKALFADLNWVIGPETDSFEAPLEIDGLAREGARLRGTVYKVAARRAVMLQVEFNAAAHKIGALDRIDWNPIHTHNNKGKGPPHLQFMKQHGSHHHLFELNYLTTEQRMRAGNLPIAVPMEPNVSTEEELLRFAEVHFRIKGLGKQYLPQWQADLFWSADDSRP